MANVAGKSLQARLSEQIDRLVSEGGELLRHVGEKDPAEALTFAARYHTWYTRALAVVRALLPDRLDELRRLYEQDPRRKQLDPQNYVLGDYVQGLAPGKIWDADSLSLKPPFDIRSAAYVKLNTQVGIVGSAASRLSDLLANIRGVVQAELFDSELGAARHLLENGFLRAAGAVAGVVLEHHLKELADKHEVKLGRKKPTIGNLSDALKQAGVLDVPDWQWVGRLGGIRNLCDHKKQREPRRQEVEDLIEGTDKAIKTLA